MKYVKDYTSHTYEEKKSKFIAYMFVYENFKDEMKKIKELHPKARHYVYAYRYLNEFDQIVENSSDDGEPKGTSGRPTLSVLAGNELINTAIITVRYFGGIKLGTGGLVRAYSDVANLIINKSTLAIYEKLELKTLICSYAYLSKAEYLCTSLEIKIKKKDFLNEINLTLEASNEKFIELRAKLQREIKLV